MLHSPLVNAGPTRLLFAAFTTGLPKFALRGLGPRVLSTLVSVFLNRSLPQKGEPLPKPVMYLHALTAVVGFNPLIAAAAVQAAGKRD